MADIIIFLGVKDIGGKPNLRLKDSKGGSGIGTLNTKVEGGDSIYWVVDNGFSIESFEIIEKGTQENIFSSAPFQISPTQWSAVVQGDLEDGSYNYEVKYTTVKGVCVDDPKLIVVPPGHG